MDGRADERAHSSDPSTARARVYVIDASRHLAELLSGRILTAHKRPNIFLPSPHHMSTATRVGAKLQDHATPPCLPMLKSEVDRYAGLACILRTDRTDSPDELV